jgi:Transcriptional regulator
MARAREEGLEKRIIEAAVSVFGIKGFQAATLRDIAESAGIATGTVYTYFADKEALFSAAFEHSWDGFCDKLDAMAAQPKSLEEKLSALLGDGLVALTATLPSLCGMFFDASRLNMIRPMIERIVDAIERLIAPYYDSDDPARAEESRRVRRTLISVFVTGIPFSVAISGGASMQPEIERLRTALQTFLDTILPLQSATRAGSDRS